MKNTKDKHLNIRLSSELYQKFVNIAIARSSKENRIVKISEIVREILKKGVEDDTK
jgi:predicted DNA-binding protein